MKKSSHSSPTKKKSASSQKAIAPFDDTILPETNDDEASLAADQLAVASRADEAASSGHRVEPIEPDEEGNAEKLVEEGLHGYLHATSKKSRR